MNWQPLITNTWRMLIMTKYHSKNFTSSNSNFHIDCLRWETLLISLSYQWGNWDTEGQSHLYKAWEIAEPRFKPTKSGWFLSSALSCPGMSCVPGPGQLQWDHAGPAPRELTENQQGWWSLEEKSALWKMVAQKRVLNSPWELGKCQWLPTIQVCFCQLCWPHRHRELRITASPNLRFSPHTCFPMLEGRTQAQGPHCLYIQILSFSW